MSDTLHDKTHREQVAHQHVPGRAYNVDEPALRLVHIIGGGFFNEPKYYDSNRPVAAFYRELLRTGRIASIIPDEMGLTEQAGEVLETAHAVARSDHPEDLLILCAWARDTKDGLKLRTTPVMLLALAAAHERTKPHVARYAPAILQRADEVRLVFGAFRHLFQQGETGRHRGGLPHSLRKGLAAVLAECSDYQLLKYNDGERPRFADVLKMVGGSRKLPGRKPAGWPVSRAMFEYLVNGFITADALPILQARQRFFATQSADEVTPELVREAGLTWENVVSHLGSSAAVWELVLPFMGEMALTRNLRNFEQAGICTQAWGTVRDKLLAVEDTVQLPFRFFAAERELTGSEPREIVSLMLERAIQNVVDLPGVTLVLNDNSGSAIGCAISTKSKLRVADAGNTLGAIIARRVGRRAILGVFGDSLVWVPFSEQEQCLAIKKRMDHLAQTAERSQHGALAIPAFRRGSGVGQNTETGLWWGLHSITENRVYVDRIILLSDLCCYTQGDTNCGHDMTPYFGKRATVQSMVDRYRETVHAGVYVHSINLNGHAQSQFRPQGERTYLLSGWSEKLLNIIRDLEQGQPSANQAPAVPLPTLETLRSRYRR